LNDLPGIDATLAVPDELCYICIAHLGIISMTASTLMALRLPSGIHARLDALAKATGRSKTYYAREAILKHLDDIEDVYLAERELEAIRASTSQTVPLEEVMREYGLEG
jgi:RHH-type rel operon transcriptional repressor/antitoxin RelB